MTMPVHIHVNLCDTGECGACPSVSTQRCQCGKSTGIQPCATPYWQCDKVSLQHHSSLSHRLLFHGALIIQGLLNEDVNCE